MSEETPQDQQITSLEEVEQLNQEEKKVIIRKITQKYTMDK